MGSFAIKTFGGSPTDVAVPPIFENIQTAIKIRTGSIAVLSKRNSFNFDNNMYNRKSNIIQKKRNLIQIFSTYIYFRIIELQLVLAIKRLLHYPGMLKLLLLLHSKR